MREYQAVHQAKRRIFTFPKNHLLLLFTILLPLIPLLLDVQLLLLGPHTTIPAVEAHGNAARIFTIAPSCAGPGDTVQITGNGFGAHNVRIYVGGQETGHGIITGGIQAQVVSATGNRATFIVPATATPGVSIVWAVNPGNHAGSIAFRAKQGEVCGNQIDEDCDGVINDVDACQPINHPPVSDAGSDKTYPVGTLVQLDGTGSSDPDGQPLTFAWTMVSKPATSIATLSNPSSVTPSFTIDVFGDYVVQLVVHDGTANSAPDTVTISTLNSPPVANAGADTGGQVSTTVILDGSGSSDIDGDALSYQWSLVSKPATSTVTLSDPSNVTPSFTIDVFGDYVVQLVVHDGMVNSAPDTVTISTLNSPPVANAGANQSAYVNEPVTLDGSKSSDVDGNTLYYSWSLVSKPSGSTASLSNASTPTPNLTTDRAGTYVAQLVVNDGLTSSQPDTVTISTLNTKPVVNAGPDQSGTVGTVIHLDGSASSDVDGDPLTYQWSLLSKPTISTTTLQNPTAVTPQFTLDKAGTYVVQLIVNDGTMESNPVTVIITTLNSKPVAEAGTNQSHPVGTTVTLNGTASSDVDGDPLTYLWSLTSKPTGSTATLSDPSAVQPTFIIDKPGNYTAQLIVNDGTVNSDPATVTISTVNSKPIANPGPDQHGVVNATITLNGSGSSDVDGDPLIYQWSLVSKPANSTAALQASTNVTTSFVLDKAGTYTVQLIVNDGTVDSDPATVTITTLNSKPIADTGPDQDTLVDQTVQLNGSGSSDVDGQTLTYFWSFTARPENSAAMLSGETLENPIFAPDLPGTYVVQLIVNDGQLDSDPDTVTITVSPESTGNRFPVADAGSDQTAQVGQTVFLDGSNSSDPDGDSLIYQWMLTDIPSGSAADLTDATTATPTFLADVVGLYVAQLTISDGRGGSTTASVTVTVTLGNRPPTVSIAATATSGTVPLSVTLTATASDPDQDPLIYTWDFGDGTTTSGDAIQLHTYTVARRYAATVTVSDGQEVVTAQLDVMVTLTPDPRSRVSGRTIDPAGNLVVGARVTCASGSEITTNDGTFSIAGLSTRCGTVQCTATFITTGGNTITGTSLSVPPVVGGMTNVGDIVLRDRTALHYPGLRLPVGVYPQSIAVADLNGDGNLDLAVPNLGSLIPTEDEDATRGVSLLFGNADGTFQPEQRLDVGGEAHGVTTADINQDGISDLLVTRVRYRRTGNELLVNPAEVAMFYGHGNGTFQSPIASEVYRVGPLAVADLNGDGKSDLVVGHGPSIGQASFNLGNGDGAFQPWQFFFSPLNDDRNAEAVAIADVNGDQILDVLTAGSQPEGVDVYLGNGNGTFRAQLLLPVHFAPRAMIVQDLNGDGILDIATANISPDAVSVLLGIGNGIFQAERQFPVGRTPHSLAAADLNHDGIPDLVVGNEITFSREYVAGEQGGNTDTVSVLFGNGDGSFQSRTTFTIGDGPHALAIADFDKDNNPDIVAVNFISDNVSVLFGKGDGTFATQKRVPTGNAPSSVVVGDFNGDRIPDAITSNSFLNDSSILLGNGDGSFGAPVSFPSGRLPGAVVADVTGDQVLDLVALDGGAQSVAVLRGNSDGTFQGRSLFPVGSFPEMVSVGDINADGSPDLVTANAGGGGLYHLSLLVSDGDGGFQAPLPITLGADLDFSEGGGPRWVTVADLNHDCKMDLAVLTSSSPDVFILLGNGDATFAAPQRFSTEDFPQFLAIADVNTDGVLDLVTSNGNSRDTSILLGNGDGTFQAVQRTAGTGGRLSVADLNGDGFVDLGFTDEFGDGVMVRFGNGDGTFQVPLRYHAGKAPVDIAVADLNRDGLLDLTVANVQSDDLSILLAQAKDTAAPPVDTSPPPPPDLSKITVSGVTNGQVTITGTQGSVEAGAGVKVVNVTTGAMATVTANIDGSFTILLTAQEGNSLAITVTDAAGNVSPVRSTQVGAAVQVAITYPAQGAIIDQNETVVRGTVQGPFNTGVTVNGVVALVHNGSFVAEHVQTGFADPVVITAVATTLSGQTAQAAVTIHDGSHSPVVLAVKVSPNSGVAPLAVTFKAQFGSTVPIQSLSMDFDGDGTFDFTTADPNAPLQHTYTTPGLYTARLRVTDQQGGMFNAEAAVAVQDVTAMDIMFKSMWSNMNAALVAGDIPTALTFLDGAAQRKYEPVWQVLLPHMAEIVASYSPLRGVEIGQNVAEYGVNRTINGENRLFLIYFLRDKTGVWRLAAL